MRRVAVLVLLSGCGRIAFDAVNDASNDTPTDSEVLGTGPFTNVRPIAELASGSDDDDPGVSRDGLELYFASKRTGDSKIWVSRRASRTASWGPPEQVLELSRTIDDKAPELSPDGLAIYYDSNGDIVMSTRASRTAAWSPPVIVIDTSDNLGTPAICGQGLRLYLRNVGAGSLDHLNVSSRATTTDAWSATTPIPELESNLGDSAPWPSADCNRLYFDSNRTQIGVAYLAYRDPMTDTFGAPIELPEIRAAGSVHDMSLTSDETYVVFSHRSTINQIYEASR